MLVLGLLSHAATWAAFPARQSGDFYSYVNVAAVANIAFCTSRCWRVIQTT
jgi:hypothetical protein